MSGADFSFSFSLPGQSNTPARAPRYIARPFKAHPVGEETLILASGADQSVRAPFFYARMLAHCDRFQTLDQHTEAVIRDFGLPADQRSAVRQGLAGLVERNLLRDESQVFADLGPRQESDQGPESPLRSLCIRTCNRPADLERLLTGLGRYIDGSSLERVFILDDAKDPAATRRTAELVSAASTSRALQLIHIDRSRRAAMVEQMAAQAGVDAVQLRWLIEGDDDNPEASYGATLNLALLLTAGERFLMIDDDALLDPFSLAPPKESLSLRVIHDFTVRFPDVDRPETGQYSALGINPLRAHERLLGRSIASIAGEHGLQDGHLLAEMSPQMIHDFSARPRVRLTTNGTVGDAGTGSMLWQYTLPADALAGWHESEEAYRVQAFSRRVARSTLETQIASSVSLMTTTLTGVDNRELLLPVPAKGRGEDLIFGIGIRFLYPGTPCCALPWMLPHRMHSPRRWEAQDIEQRQGAGLTSFLATAIEDLGELELSEEPFARADILATWIQHLADRSPPQLLGQLREHLLQRRADMADRVLKTFQNLANPPIWLRRDFASIIERHGRIQPEDDQKLEALCPTIRSFAADFGQALPAWTKTWLWAASVDVFEVCQA